MPRSYWPTVMVALAAALTIVAVAAVAALFLQTAAGPAELAARQVENFHDAAEPGVRLSALRTLFRLGYDSAALDLFYGLAPAEQLALFREAPEGSGPALADLAREIGPTLDGRLPGGQSDALLDALRESLREATGLPSEDRLALVAELRDWSQGRALARSSPQVALLAYDTAIESYDAAATAGAAEPTPLRLYQAPPALVLERAGLRAATGQHVAALADLDALLGAFAAPPARSELLLPTPTDPAALARRATAHALNPLLDGERIRQEVAALVLADEALWRALLAAPDRYQHLPAALLDRALALASATAQAQTASAISASATAQAQTASAAARASASAAARALTATSTYLAADTDGDGLSTSDELGRRTEPDNPDTDGDGLNDGEDPDPLAAPTPTSAPALPTARPTARPAPANPRPTPASAPTSSKPVTDFPTPDLD